MRAGWKFSAALGFVGAVAVAAAAFGQVGTPSPDASPNGDEPLREQRRARLAECRERFRDAGTDEERAAIREECGKRRGHRGHRLARRMVHGEVKVQTEDGFATIITDVGTVTSVAGEMLTLERADGENVTVTASDETTIRRDREEASMADIQVGDHVKVVQIDDGDARTVRGIHARSAEQADDADAAATRGSSIAA